MGKDINVQDDPSLKGKADLFDQLMSDPDIRESTMRHLQKLNPTTVLPEVRVMDRVNEGFAALNKRLDDERVAREQDELKERLEAEKSSATRGMKAEEVTALEKLMTDRRIGSYASARELYDFQQKAAIPNAVPAARQRGGMPSNLKDIVNNPQKWGRDQAYAALDELAQRRALAERV